MSTTLGSLVLMLRADSATFASDLGKGATMAEASANKMAKSLSKVNDAFAMLAGGFGFQQLLSYSNSVITATAHLGELSAATGLTVPVLSSLAVTAKSAGLSVDDVAGSFDKLQKQAASGAIGSRAQADAFAKIGLSATQLAAGLKDPPALLLEVAAGMERFADDGNKTALMMTVFGRGGAQMNSVLHDLVATGYENANATAEQAAKAQEFEKQMAQLSATIQGSFRTALMTLIPVVKLATAGIITTFSDMWIDVKLGWDTALNGLTLSIGKWRTNISGAFGSALLMVSPQLGPLVANLMAPKNDGSTLKQRTDAATAAHKFNAGIMANASADYVNSMTPPVVPAKTKLPSVGVLPAVAKLASSGNDGLIKAMDERLKIIATAMKAEDAATKLANTQLEADYSHGNMSLAEYSTDKNAILENSFKNTQALYDAEIGLAGTYAKQIEAKLAKQVEQQKTVDPTQAAKLTAQIAATQSELDQATSKLVVLTDDKAISATKHTEDQVTVSTDLIAKSTDLARSLTDVNIAYAQMSGDTVTAAKLQIEQQDAFDRTKYAANGATDALTKMAAVEANTNLFASQKGLDGMTRAIKTYSQNIANVAKQTEEMTTNMLQSMEDALVNFVMTGKLDFKSLITSMIADLVRLQIQQSIMPGLSGMLGTAMTAMFGGGVASTGLAATGESVATLMANVPALAGGGPVVAGGTYTVGEHGPETFVPSAAGSIVPNGGGSGSIVYSPVIQIDSRSDRAAVMSDTVKAVRQGNSDLLAQLRRYNPGLKI